MAAMREPTFLILTALASGPRHGYGVIKDVAELSDGRLTLLAGTLYQALDRLAAEGLVELDREEWVDGRRRRYYRLTDAGRVALAERAIQLQHVAKVARSRLRTATPRPLPGVS